MTSRRDFIKGMLTAAAVAYAPKWLPDPAPLPGDELPIGYVEVIGNTNYYFDKEVIIPEGDVILLDGRTVHRPKNIKLLPGGIASVCKTGHRAWAIWGAGLTV